MFLSGQFVFSQLEFTKRHSLLFVGVHNNENNQMILSVEITPMSESELKLHLWKTENWIEKNSENTVVKLDITSVGNDLFFIQKDGEEIAAYRYFDNRGLQILIGKEAWHGYYTSGKKEEQRHFNLSYAKIILPENSAFDLKETPVMFEK